MGSLHQPKAYDSTRTRCGRSFGPTVRAVDFGQEPDCRTCRALIERDIGIVAAMPKFGVLLHDDAGELFGDHLLCERPAVVDVESVVERILTATRGDAADATRGPAPRFELEAAVHRRLRDVAGRTARELGIDCIVGTGDIADPRDKRVIDLTPLVIARLLAA
ncbi:MAG: hypothetical protein KDC98_12285 [Planctomycetes bacterium]|nr:hypothetical protein [Planctomycetota bacterium]